LSSAVCLEWTDSGRQSPPLRSSIILSHPIPSISNPVRATRNPSQGPLPWYSTLSTPSLGSGRPLTQALSLNCHSPSTPQSNARRLAGLILCSVAPSAVTSNPSSRLCSPYQFIPACRYLLTCSLKSLQQLSPRAASQPAPAAPLALSITNPFLFFLSSSSSQSSGPL
jgi:hypothetical protein